MSKDHLWTAGQSGNPTGRPVGARNIRTKEVLELIRAQGHKDPLVTLSELQNSSQDEAIRATAANMLAPYLHSKLAAKPQPPDPIYIEQAISLPPPSTIRQAVENIYKLSEMKSTGKLDIVTADSLIADHRVILDALVDEQKLLTAQGGPPEQVIRIEGGLPLLPGTDVIMPTREGGPRDLNGHAATPELLPGSSSLGDPPSGSASLDGDTSGSASLGDKADTSECVNGDASQSPAADHEIPPSAATSQD